MSKLTFANERVLPCKCYFETGHAVLGFITLFMQLTLVLWPVASSMAASYRESQHIKRLLEELSETH